MFSLFSDRQTSLRSLNLKQLIQERPRERTVVVEKAAVVEKVETTSVSTVAEIKDDIEPVP